MTHRLVIWKSVACKNVAGGVFHSDLPIVIEHYYKGKLIAEILNMPRKKPITFEEGVRMAGQNFMSADKVGHARHESYWYLNFFVDWISELGFHIELTGDEFEAAVISDKVV